MKTQAAKWQKRFIAFLFDVSVTLNAWLIAAWLAGSNFINELPLKFFFGLLATQCIVYGVCGLYRGVWRFASLPDVVRIIRAISLSTLLIIVLVGILRGAYPFKLYLINALLLVSFLTGGRFIFRLYRDYPKLSSQSKRILVVGAGNAGEGLIRDLYRSALHYQYYPIVLVDDNPIKHGSEVQGVRVVGRCKDIPKLVQRYDIELILIAIPSLASKRMRDIVSYCEQAKVPFRTLPSLKAIADGEVKMGALREVLLEDLLGREQVNLDMSAIKKLIRGKTILVTGGGGSIGSELCRQIAALNPQKLVIVDSNEFNLYSIDMELKNLSHTINLHSHLCDVTDKTEMAKIFGLYKPDIVYHVAAYKHVPLLEKHIRIAMHNNIIGTRIVANFANEFKVHTFVLISTDKAVNPSNIMGATKRAAEIFCQTLNLYSSTRFITVRFGNVLNSAGSVLPLFHKQLQEGGPLTVTHPDITRYFMTIPEAALLIMQATTLNNEGEIFVLDMGEPISIRYLAEQMIKLSGKVIGQDVSIIYTGLRPGEKLFEELFHEAEYIGGTSHPKINQAKSRHFEWDKLEKIMLAIKDACAINNDEALFALLNQLVPEYQRAMPLLSPLQQDEKLVLQFS